MQKLSENEKINVTTLKRVLISSFFGIAALAAACMVFALLVVYEVLPERFLVLYACISGFMGGVACGLIMRKKGKMLLYTAAAFVTMMSLLLLLGALMFQNPFSFSANPFMPLAVFAGILLANIIINAR